MPQIAIHGATTHIFKAIEITNKMMHNAPMMTLTCIMKRACFFSFDRVIIMALNISFSNLHSIYWPIRLQERQ